MLTSTSPPTTAMSYTRPKSMMFMSSSGSFTWRKALRQVKDPELDMNIIDLGLVYDIAVVGGEVEVNMTLTSPGCPAGPMITNDAYKVIRALDGVKDVNIEIVWEPYWTPEKMDPKVRALMGL